jgi:hypothetical protein
MWSLGVAIDAEAEGILEDLLVAVARRVEEADRLALADRPAAQLHVAGGGARELDDRGDPADGLLDGALHQRSVRGEILPLARVVDEGLDAAGHGVARGLVSGHDQQEVVGEQLEVGQGLVVDLPLHDHRQDVVAWIRPALLCQLLEVGEELDARGLGSLVGGASALELRILRRDDLVGPAEEQMPVLFRDAQHERDHGDGDRRGHVGDEVDVPLPPGRVEHLARDRLDLRRPHLHGARREPLRNEVPVAAVIRRIHRQQVAARRLLGSVPREDGDARLDDPIPRVLADRDDVFVFRDRPERVGGG